MGSKVLNPGCSDENTSNKMTTATRIRKASRDALQARRRKVLLCCPLPVSENNKDLGKIISLFSVRMYDRRYNLKFTGTNDFDSNWRTFVDFSIFELLIW